MQLERVVAKDIRSAFDEVKERFGEDVLVVSNQKLGRSVELIVAVDIAVNSAANEPAPQKPAVMGGLVGQVAFEDALKKVADRVGTHPWNVTAGGDNPNADDAFDAQRLRELTTLIKGEFAALRQEFHLAKRLSDQYGKPHETSVLMDELYASGFPLALGHLLEHEIGAASDLGQGLDQLQTLLTQSLAVSQPVQLRGVHWVLGTAGSGKSSMAARLVHSAVDEFGEDAVVLVSFCDRKGGAWSQTQLSAAGAGVAAYRAQTAENLQALLEALSGMDCIVIDTGTQFDPEDLAQMCERAKQDTVHCVVAADVSEYAARHQMAACPLAVDTVCVSRMDGGTLPWPLTAALIDSQLPVSGYSDGVPVRSGMTQCTASQWVAHLVAQFAQSLEAKLMQASARQQGENSVSVDTLAC